MDSNTPFKSRPSPAKQGSTPFRSSSNRFRSSLVPMNRSSPARATNLNKKLTTTSSHGRDLFRTTTPQSTRTIKFAPNIPADAARATPSARKFAQKSTGGGMSSIASADLFKMRIPSPDPELSGEALSKEVPEDPHRTGTIYADQFLAHKCPPSFDDLQRRQFFCVLDLRRLKYAADEIFAKKDWKLNIMNFAKEYEKSRGLIMLRYGLYEFKNVKPSEEVLKRWRATHNLPDPSPEEEKPSSTSTQNGRRVGVSGAPSTKRKAEEELTPKDNALMASNANQNKRRNTAQEPADRALTGPAPFKKSKRKAEETDEPDENQPSKVQRPAPSAAKSKFESILNNSQSGSASPPKRPALAPQKSTESQTPAAIFSNSLKPLPASSANESESSGSVLSGHKIGSTPVTNTGNIFSYLSGSSSGSSSGNENGNAEDDDTESESEQESGNQKAPTSNGLGAASSTRASIPPTQNGTNLFSASKPTGASSLFAAADKPNDLASKGGLFGRVQMGSNGQPLRAAGDVSEQDVFASKKQPSPEKEQSMTPAKQPGDYTFNPATTPITFGQPVASAPKSSTTAESEPSKESGKPNSASLFGAGAQAAPAFQPAGQSIFSTATDTKSNAAASSIFSGQKPALSSSLFGTPVAKSDSSAVKEQQKSTSAITTGPLNPTPEAETNKMPSASGGPSALFGGAPLETKTSTPQMKSMFGNNLSKAGSQTNGNVTSQSGSGKDEKSPASSLFGGSSTTTSFGAGNAQASGSGNAKSLFGAPMSAADPSSQKSEPPAAKSTGIFGNSTTTSTNLFGSKSGETSPAGDKPAALFSFGASTKVDCCSLDELGTLFFFFLCPLDGF
ncbi:hypothetical protein GGR52DRAFT_301026 [Hypoxylon sp. FL1284]|nr:hypothetical protein GGR52DRAFT_301026 [Hypoxylon sp. FL1284]